MATPTMLWRWQPNPLRRRIDVVEQRLFLAAGLCATTGSLLIGVVTRVTTADHLDEQQAGQHPVQAVVVKETADPAAVSSGRLPMRATVRWRGTNGPPHTSQTDVGVGVAVAVGSRTTVWTDAHGRPTSNPLPPSQVALDAGGAGTAAAVATSSVALGGTWATHRLLDRRRMRQWDRDWVSLLRFDGHHRCGGQAAGAAS
ncbi:hypothetical protein ACIQ9J_02610 [Streptomyces sp. NPDC094153]|uniref:Rv1733c family protein n=1 Tax=Streptomyces sp. NPDC094153 TaxID=3366058 RepID=UPI003810B5CB